MKYIYSYIAIILAAALLGSCSPEENNLQKATVKTETETLKINVSLDGDPTFNEAEVKDTLNIGEATAVPAGTRATEAPGDPGSAESHTLPTVGYIFISYSDGNGSHLLYKKVDMDASNWHKSIASSATLPTHGDEVYNYRDEIQVVLPANRGSNAKCYMLVAPKDGNKELVEFTEDTKAMVDSAGAEHVLYDDDINHAKCNFLPATTKDANGNEFWYLGDVYATPYNLHKNNDRDANYYATIDGFSTSTPSIDLRLYHMAAKVDLMWNIDPNIQGQTKINGLYFFEQLRTDCYMFRLTENPRVTNSEWEKWFGTKVKTDIGNQWYGRYSFYTIPFHYGISGGDYRFYIKFKVWQCGTQMPDDPKNDFIARDANGDPILRDGVNYKEGMGYSTGESDNSFLVKMYVSTLDEIFPTYYRPNLRIQNIPQRTVDTDSEYKFTIYYNY